MPAEKEVAPARPATEYKGTSPDGFIEFASRSLEDLFLSYVDEVAKGKSATSQQFTISTASAAPITNCATASGTTTTFPPRRNRDVHANTEDLGNRVVEQLAEDDSLRRQRTSSASSAFGTEMAPENSSTNSQQPAARNENAGGQPFYEQQRKKLQALLKKRTELEQKLVSCRAASNLLINHVVCSLNVNTADAWRTSRLCRKKKSTRKRRPTSRTRPLATS